MYGTVLEFEEKNKQHLGKLQCFHQSVHSADADVVHYAFAGQIVLEVSENLLYNEREEESHLVPDSGYEVTK